MRSRAQLAVLVATAMSVSISNEVRAGAFVSPKNLLLLQSNGDGGFAYSADSLTLNEFNPATLSLGVPVNTINLPVNTLSYNGNTGLGLTLPESSDHDGQLTLSDDGHNLVFGTYLSAVGLVNGVGPNNVSPDVAPRVITVLHPNGTLDSTTRLTGAYDYNSVSLRQVSSLDGTQFWTSGNGDKPYGGSSTQDIGGLRYATLGASSTVSLNVGNGIDLRTTAIRAGQLYGAGGSNNNPTGQHTVSQLGSGLPTSSAPSWNPLPATGAYANGTIFGNQSPVFLTLNDGNSVLYLSDSTGGSLEKYLLVNGNWVFEGQLYYKKDNIENVGASVSGGTVSIYVTNAASLYSITDVGGAGILNIPGLTNTHAAGQASYYPTLPAPVLTSNGDSVFRGVSFAPSSSAAVGEHLWSGVSGATWTSPTSWADGLPDGSGGTATFGPASPGLSTSGTIALGANHTVGHVIFNNAAASYTLGTGGTGTLIIDNTDANASGVPSIAVLAGNHTIAAPISLVAGVTLSAQYNTSLTITGGISGTGGVSFNGLGQITSAVTLPMLGSLTLGGVSTYVGDTAVNSGTATLAASASLPAATHLTIGDGINTAAVVVNASAGTTIRQLPLASVSLRQNSSLSFGTAGAPGRRTVLVTSGLSIANDGGPLGNRTYYGQINLTNNDMIIRNGSLPDITEAARAGQNAAALFTGNGLTSSIAATDANGLLRYAVGVIQNDFEGGTIYDTFDGVPVTGNDVLVKFTYFGDADLNGVVDDTDFFLINNGYANHLTGWLNGDFDYSGVVDDTDFFLMNNAFGLQSGSLRAGDSVPEPATFGLAIMAAATLSARRRR